MQHNLRHYLTLPFTIDLRTLALFRVCLGWMVLADLVMRLCDLTAFHTDAGVVPRIPAIFYGNNWAFSLHFASGSAIWQIILITIHGLFAFALLVGYRTRIATFFTLFLTISIQQRNHYILQGSDILLTLLLFWSLFLPLGARFSFDEGLNKTPTRSNSVVSMATAALLLQAMSVYFFSALLKNTPEWRTDATSVLFALQGGAYGSTLGHWFSQFKWLTHVLSIYVWYLEFLGPFLMFISIYYIPARLLMQFLFISMHIGFLFLLSVGQFPWISITSLLAFTPGTVWTWIGQKVSTKEREGIVIYYDKPCGFCQKISLILRSFLLFPHTRVLAAQEHPDIYAIMQKNNSWVVTDHSGQAYIHWQAMLILFKNSPIFGWLFPLLNLQLLRNLGNTFYYWVANNRSFLSEKTYPWLVMRAQSITTYWLTNLIVFVFIIIMFLSNIHSVLVERFPLPQTLQQALYGFNLYQYWNMFAVTKPFQYWYVAQGKTKNGKVVDVYRGNFDETLFKPSTAMGASDWDPNFRWRKFVTNLWSYKNTLLPPFYSGYLCNKWNAKHSKQDALTSIKILYVEGGGAFQMKPEESLINEIKCG